MRRLPATLDDLRGLRAARWVRESTAGQADNFGPDAQREQQDRAIERYGLVDTGIAWQVAHSGKTVATTAQWRDMLARAGREYDVLVVGYVSRFARDLRTAVNARHDLHALGAVVLFADDRILTSDEDAWEQWAREAVESEAYSRRLGRRIREGYAAKRRRHGDPGGRAPFGFVRETEKPHRLMPEPSKGAAIGTVFELAAVRLTDRQVAERTGIPLYTVRGMLTSPLYAGRLRDGRPAAFEAIVPADLFERVAAIRELRRTRDRRPAKARIYALSMLRCAACGRRLIGDTGRYRHPEHCAAFVAAAVAPRRPKRGQHRVSLGSSYPATTYEGLVSDLLSEISAGAALMAEVLTDEPAPPPDRLALARIERDRDAALARYRRTRDAGELAATMAHLDAAQAEAQATPAIEPLSAAEKVAYLGNLATMWADAPPAGRRILAESLIERLDVLGLRRMHVEPTEAAVRWGIVDAFHARTHGFGRGERCGRLEKRLFLRADGQRVAVTFGGPRRAPLRIVRSA